MKQDYVSTVLAQFYFLLVRTVVLIRRIIKVLRVLSVVLSVK